MQRRNLTALLLLLVVVGPGRRPVGTRPRPRERATSRQRSSAIEDSDLSKVVLTEDAAKRIGLETGTVALSNVDSDVVVRGRVATDPAAAGTLLVHVSLPATELAQVDISQARPCARGVRERRGGRSVGGRRGVRGAR